MCLHLEIKEDIRDECGKFGDIIDMNIPRPTGGSRQSAGLGKVHTPNCYSFGIHREVLIAQVYVRFNIPESAHKALRALAGRKFADRTVVCSYFPEV